MAGRQVRHGYLEWQAKVRGTNISDVTLLATDYLNHFNEVIMLIGMVPDMPEMLAECRAWAPKSYKQHFEQSGFSDRDLAIAAYDHVPRRFRERFDATVKRLDISVRRAINRLDADLASGRHPELTRHRVQETLQELQRLIERAAAIINGAETVLDQSEIDAIMDEKSAHPRT